MKREEVRDFLISLGIEEPTNEQISSYLNKLQKETDEYRSKAEQGRRDADLVAELQAKLDEIENQNLSDIEKANKSVETANKTIADLEAKMKAMEMKNSLASIGINGEEADQLIANFGAGQLNVELLGQIIANREKLASIKKEEEIANNSSNPDGGSNGKDDDADKTEDLKVAESVAKSFASDKTSEDIVSSYL